MARWTEGWRLIAVNDAYKLMPRADALYACDWSWWTHHDGVKDFYGRKFTSHSQSMAVVDDKSAKFGQYGIEFVDAKDGKGFGKDRIHYGNPAGNSGFQAVNLALLLGASVVLLVGFDGRHVNGASHFFGAHHANLKQCPDEGYRHMAQMFPPDERVINCTPGSTITAYRQLELENALELFGPHGSVHRDRAVSNA